jgi:hypothetical protein
MANNDPDHFGAPATKGSKREATVALEVEEAGKVQGVLERPPPRRGSGKGDARKEADRLNNEDVTRYNRYRLNERRAGRPDPGPYQDRSGADFVERLPPEQRFPEGTNERLWDHKGFRSGEKSVSKIIEEIDVSFRASPNEGIIIDTAELTPTDLANLPGKVRAKGWDNPTRWPKVIFHP